MKLFLWFHSSQNQKTFGDCIELGIDPKWLALQLPIGILFLEDIAKDFLVEDFWDGNRPRKVWHEAPNALSMCVHCKCLSLPTKRYTNGYALHFFLHFGFFFAWKLLP